MNRISVLTEDIKAAFEVTSERKKCHEECPLAANKSSCCLTGRYVFAEKCESGFTASILTISDKGSKGLRADTAGPAVKQLLTGAGFSVTGIEILPDEIGLIKTALIRAADVQHIHLVVTVGGTGFAPRDVTPEATLAVCERMTPGIPETMRAESLKITKRAMLSRAQAGIRGRTLIVNLPGSEKAAKENLTAIIEGLRHGLDMLNEKRNECASVLWKN